MPALIEACCAALAHDPNYSYDDDVRHHRDNDSGMAQATGASDVTMDSADEMDDEDTQEEEEEAAGEEEDDDAADSEYSDDEDVSWKVRRAAAKCLEAIVTTQHAQLAPLFTRIGRVLIGRMKEREENVKAEVFSAYSALLRQVRLALPHHVVGQADRDAAAMRAVFSSTAVGQLDRGEQAVGMSTFPQLTIARCTTRSSTSCRCSCARCSAV